MKINMIAINCKTVAISRTFWFANFVFNQWLRSVMQLRKSLISLGVNPVGAKATDMTAEGWVVSDYYFVDKIFTRKSQFNIGRGHGNMPANNLKHLLRPFWGHSRPSSRLGQRGRIWDPSKYSAVQLWKKSKEDWRKKCVTSQKTF